MEWHGNKFHKQQPPKPPAVRVHLSILHDTQKSFGKESFKLDQGTARDKINILAYADTGAQTCCAGTNLLDTLNCPISYLIPTSHNIRGITETSLAIVGVLLVKIEANNQRSHQTYISENVNGLIYQNRH